MIWKKERKTDCFTAPDIKGKNKINGDIAVCDISVHFFYRSVFVFFPRMSYLTTPTVRETIVKISLHIPAYDLLIMLYTSQLALTG